MQWSKEKKIGKQKIVNETLHRKLRLNNANPMKIREWTSMLSNIPEIAENAYLMVNVWRYQRGKSKKDKQYNGNKGNGQNDKQWSTKHYTENYDPALRSPILRPTGSDYNLVFPSKVE